MALLVGLASTARPVAGVFPGRYVTVVPEVVNRPCNRRLAASRNARPRVRAWRH